MRRVPRESFVVVVVLIPQSNTSCLKCAAAEGTRNSGAVLNISAFYLFCKKKTPDISLTLTGHFISYTSQIPGSPLSGCLNGHSEGGHLSPISDL